MTATTANPTCPTCLGMGFISPADPQQRAIPCPSNCSLPELRNRMLRNANLPKLWNQTIADIRWPNNGLYDLAQQLYNLLHDHKHRGIFVIQGGHGTGKSHLLKATVYTAATLGLATYYTNVYEHMKLEQTFAANGTDPTLQKHRAMLTTARVIALDELDKRRDTQFGQEKYTDLIYSLYDAADKHAYPPKLILMATNAPIEQEPPHIQSRLLPHTIRIKGRDQRLQETTTMPAMPQTTQRTQDNPY